MARMETGRIHSIRSIGFGARECKCGLDVWEV